MFVPAADRLEGGMRPDHDDVAAHAGESVPKDSLDVQYRGRLQIAVSGRFTGTLYRLSRIKPVQRVDARDAFQLLDSGLFGVAQ